MTTDTPPADTPAKRTLFCPECGHASPCDGDWTRARSGRTVHYHCPDCHTEITARPATAEPTADSTVGLWTRWADSVRAWQTVWLKPLLRS